ncbi:RNA helicase, putative [Plasmodium gallinaceum]|uniref:RNA helicase, putative n=1 Tax=Plasmodium gallinaceum TaxID=5849 RepID=A0A1J1H3U9_PLAGA|nr:RNA helicase, putative [Plasmodium gallinaceum]CRG98026.1 RNA helicase, putative [Plasmodium gallinaceum]
MRKIFNFHIFVNKKKTVFCSNLKSRFYSNTIIKNEEKLLNRNISETKENDHYENYLNDLHKNKLLSNAKNKDNENEQRKKKDKKSLKEELHKTSFLEYSFKTDIYLKLNELKIINPTQIQKCVIPLLLNFKNKCSSEENKIITYKNKNIYNDILKNKININEYLKNDLNIKKNFYDVNKYKFLDNSASEYEDTKKEEDYIDEKKCFNDVYLIISPDNSGKTLSYFLPILHNFYLNNEKIMKNLSNFYNFLNKNNYKKFKNKIFRKKERLRFLKNKENMFFGITYEKYKINNRYINIRKYNNYNINNYFKNKKNNILNCLKHKKNIFFPYAIILTNTRESAFELFSFLKKFDINIELLSGGYLNKKKSIKKHHMGLVLGNNNNLNSEEIDDRSARNSEFLNNYDLLKKIKRNKNNSKNIINYNIDILIGTPDKIFEKVENYKNKHLYNFKFLKYVVIEEAETLCNVFNEKKLQLIFNHIKNYTNMYYFQGDVSNTDIMFEKFNFDNQEKIKKMKQNEIENDEIKNDEIKNDEIKNLENNNLNKKKNINENILRQNESDIYLEEMDNNSNQNEIVDNCNEMNKEYNKSMKSEEISNNSGNIVSNFKNSNENQNANNSEKKNKEYINNLENFYFKNNANNNENGNIKQINTKENVKNTLNSNIPITIFVSPTKTVAISEFLNNNIKSKYIQHIININSHNINNYIKHIFINSKNKEKISLLLEMLDSKEVNKYKVSNHSHFLNKYVIFCNTKRSVLNLKNILTELKYNVSYIYNEMNYKERTRNYREFKKNKTNILICTNILSRGVQFENVKIINYDISNNINDYIYKSSKVTFNSNSTDNSLTTFFNKKNASLVNDILERTVDKKQIMFQNLNKKVSKMLKLQSNYYDIIKKKKKFKKKGGRKAMKISPRRNCLSKKNKIFSKKLYFYHKMDIERKRLIKKGILKPHEKIPRYPNRKAEVYDSNEYNSVNKLDDGSLQILAKKRKTKKNKIEEETKYEEDTIVLDNMPTYEEESKIKEKKHQKKTYF